ncbi:MAG TPA: hypothetical protein VE990_01430 [Acidimicrobiales bacterium]|nr:hypothetical protein [Acidimicrobiales bacterium]
MSTATMERAHELRAAEQMGLLAGPGLGRVGLVVGGRYLMEIMLHDVSGPGFAVADGAGGR